MKEVLQQLAEYSIWANQQLATTINALPHEIHHKEIVSSFSSLYRTILHMWDAENIWWQRMKLQERISRPSDSFRGTMQEACNELLQQNKEWSSWIKATQERQLDHMFQYRNMKGEQFKQPIYQMLLHLFNHGTYHRGQLVTILRQLGVEKIPATDFIIWSRKG